MPLFRYKAVDQRGRHLEGTMAATNETMLEERLRTAGVWLIHASATRQTPGQARAEESAGWTNLFSPVSRRDLIDFCTLMAFQTKVGVSLVQALQVAAHDCENPAFRKVLLGLQKHLESGLLLHEGMERYPRVFTPHFVSVIQAGETSSKLPETFTDLRDYLEWVEQVIADVRQASLYPSIVLLVILGFVLFLFTTIIPKFAALLTSVDVQLPLLTRIIFGLGSFAKATWWLWLLGGALFLLSITVGRRVSPEWAFFLDRVKLRLPVFGGLNWMLAISRFTHNLAILYRSGIPIIQALHLSKGLVGNLVVERAVAGVEEAIKAGSIISEAMRRYPVFPPLLLRMVVMGETTGNLDHALDNVAEFYNDVIPRRIKKVFTVMEPALMLGLIGLVGAVALSIYMPILSLMSAIK